MEGLYHNRVYQPMPINDFSYRRRKEDYPREVPRCTYHPHHEAGLQAPSPQMRDFEDG